MDGYLTKLYFSRYLKEGRMYIILGIVIPIVVFVLILKSGAYSDSSAVSGYAASLGLKDIGLYIATTLFPFMLPLFAVIGSSMTSALYSEDKTNGFYEFVLSSTRMGTKDIFWSIVLTSLIVSAIILAILLSIMIVVFLAANGSLPPSLNMILAIYTVPVTVIASLIGTSVAFLSEAMTRKISFVNSPAGLAPLIGVVITLIPLIMSQRLITTGGEVTAFYGIMAVYVCAAFVLLIGIFMLTTRRMVRERFLS